MSHPALRLALALAIALLVGYVAVFWIRLFLGHVGSESYEWTGALLTLYGLPAAAVLALLLKVARKKRGKAPPAPRPSSEGREAGRVPPAPRASH